MKCYIWVKGENAVDCMLEFESDFSRTKKNHAQNGSEVNINSRYLPNFDVKLENLINYLILTHHRGGSRYPLTGADWALSNIYSVVFSLAVLGKKQQLVKEVVRRMLGSQMFDLMVLEHLCAVLVLWSQSENLWTDKIHSNHTCDSLSADSLTIEFLTERESQRNSVMLSKKKESVIFEPCSSPCCFFSNAQFWFPLYLNQIIAML